MAQYKIYGHGEFLRKAAAEISDAIHLASVAALGLPEEKRFHRFLPLEPWQFIAPADRTEKYLIIEVMMFEGRSVDVKKQLYRDMLANLERFLEIDAQDVELTIDETPRHNWLIRGLPGDELQLPYQVERRSAE